MLATIRRILAYSVTACALIYLTIVLQNILRVQLVRIGLADVITLGGLPDLISQLPVFVSVQADIAVFVIGAIGWLVIQHDRNKMHEGSGNLVRAVFLAGLTLTFTLRILPELLLVVRNAETLAQDSLPIASPLASAIAWGAATGLVQVEWSFRRLVDGKDQTIAMFFAFLGQWVAVILVIWSIGQVVQSLLQSAFAPLRLCSTDLNIGAQILTFILRYVQQCTDTPPLLGAALVLILVVAALALYSRWGTLYENNRIKGLSAIIVAAIAGAVICFNSVLGIRFMLDVITRDPQADFPLSLLSTPGSFGTASYPFAGPLLAGLLVLTYYTWRERRYLLKTGYASGMLNGLVTLSFLVGLLLFYGGWVLLGHIFVAILHNLGISQIGVDSNAWKFGLMFSIPGVLLGIPLGKILHPVGKPKASGTVQGRIYVIGFQRFTIASTAISGSLLLAILGTDLLGTPVDPTNYWWPHMLAVIAFNVPLARYFYDLRRRWQ